MQKNNLSFNMANISSLEVEASKATLENLSSETIQNENMNMIFIFLDNIHYVAGDSVTGEVLVSLPHNSTESKIIINSIGVEEVYIYASDNLDAPFVEDTSDVYRFESVIKDWHKGTSAGQYVFPFSFKLPSYCPATFYYTGEDNLGNHLKAEISYSVSVKLQNDRNPEENQTHSRMFVVRNRYTRGKPCEKIETNEQVSGCC